MQVFDQKNSVAERAVEEQRASRNVEAPQEIRVRDEQALHEIRTRGDLIERFTTPIADVEQQSSAHIQNLHHQNV